MVSRRTLLVGGGAALVLAGGGWTFTRTPWLALKPWSEATEGFGDPLLDALAYALLAPNPHNMQPWVIDRRGPLSFQLQARRDRLLPETDPPSRQITIGLGSFLEVFRQAASAMGYRASITPLAGFDDMSAAGPVPIADVALREDPSVSADPLFSFVLDRRTARTPFEQGRRVPNEDLQAIADAAVPGAEIGFSDDQGQVDELRQLTVSAWDIEWATPPTRHESIVVTRVGKDEINQDPWGLAIPGAFPEAMKIAGVLTRDGMDDPQSVAYKQTRDFYAVACSSAADFIWAVTKTNTRFDQLTMGASWVRMHLMATKLGVSFHPLSQALQEFPEMEGHYQRVHGLLAPQGGTVQMLSRLGYTRSPPRSPREPLMAKLIEG
ncbi:MAG: twin-arginine translocation pathway signal protein [Pseudomonadota bacterium]